MIEEVSLQKIVQKSRSAMTESEYFRLVGKIDMATWIENESRTKVVEFVHTLYGREIERIIIPAVKVKKGVFRRIFDRIVGFFLPFLKFDTEKEIRGEIVIALNQYFPKLIVPAGAENETLYLAAAKVEPEGQRAVGFAEIDAERFRDTSSTNRTRKEAKIHIDLKENPPKFPFKK